MSKYTEYLSARWRGEPVRSFRTDEDATQKGRERAQSLLAFLSTDRIAGTLSFITASGFASSLLYNRGYFTTIDVGAIHLLTPGDYTTLAIPFIVGALIAIYIVALLFLGYLTFMFLLGMVLEKTSDLIPHSRARLRNKNSGEFLLEPSRGKFGHFLNDVKDGAIIGGQIVFTTIVLVNFTLSFLSSESNDVGSILLLFSVLALLYFGVAFIFVVNLSVRPRGEVVVFTLIAFFIPPILYFFGSARAHADYFAFEGLPDKSICRDVGDNPLDLREECLVRVLERGVVYRRPVVVEDALDETRIFFSLYDGSTNIEYRLDAEHAEYWIDDSAFRWAQSIPWIERSVRRRITAREARIERNKELERFRREAREAAQSS